MNPINLVRKAVAFILAAILLLADPQVTQATPTMTLSDGTTTVAVVDEGLNDQASGIPGLIQYTGAVGAWSLTVTTVLTKPISGTPAAPYLDVNTTVTSTGPGTLTIQFCDDNDGPTYGTATISNGGQLAPGATMTYSTLISDKNAQFTGNPLAAPMVFNTNPFGGSTTVNISQSGLYSLTEVLSIVHPVAGTSSADASISITPGTPPMTGSIGDFVWNDYNQNGLQDANEPGIPNVTVNLYNSLSTLVTTTTTDVNGHYQFTGLPAGTYTVVVDQTTLPDGFVASPSLVGADRSVDSNGSPATVVLPDGTSDQTIDFGFHGTGTIGDFVWMDMNEDGIQQAAEPGIAGVTVYLKDTGGTILQTTVTDSTGHYLFTGLSAGNYTVLVDTSSPALAGFVATMPLVGSDRTVDSNDNPSPVTLATNSFNDLTVDFGFIPSPAGSIGDFVWKDTNGNGTQDGTATEPGIPNVRLNLYLGSTASGTPIQTTLTDSTGLYLFKGLVRGTYTVAVDETTIPVGYTRTLVNAPGSNPANDSNPNPATVILPLNTSSDTTIDFGYVPPASGSIGDFVWHDLNGNGIQDAGEPGIDGVKVTLKNAGGTVLQSTTTSGGGKYLFTGLTAGTYSVVVDDTSLLASGYYRTITNAPGSNPANDSNPNPSTVVLATNASVDLTQDFGYATPCDTGVLGGINLNGIINNNVLFLFANGSQDANWQSASNGYVGNVLVDGKKASERTSGKFAYAGTIYTNAASLGVWQSIVTQNVGQAFGSTGNTALISGAEANLNAAFAQINSLPATPGFTSVSAQSLNGLNTQDGVAKTYVINITSGFQVSTKINITGDPGDVFILRWDTDANPANGYQGQVKFQSGGAIVPLGGLKASNFINVAGDLSSSGGGSNPPAPYPQGPRLNGGTGSLIAGASNFNGGGFFTGYWLTTGDPVTGNTQPLSNGIFVGGWYTLTNKFSLTSGCSGVFVPPNCN